MEKKIGLILGGMVLLSLVLVVGFVMAVSEEASAGATVTVNEFVDISIVDTGTAGFSFGSQDPGTTNNKEVDQIDGSISTTPAVKVKRETTSNVDVKVRLKGNDFNGGPGTIAVTKVAYNDDGVVDGSLVGLAQKDLATTYPGTAYTTLATGNPELKVWFWLDVPTSQAAGSYTSTFFFEGNSA